MRWWKIFKAHAKANAYVLAELARDTWRGGLSCPLLVYTRWSIEDHDKRGATRVARQVGVGYWTRPINKQAPQWVNHKIYFLEEYDTKEKQWKQTI